MTRRKLHGHLLRRAEWIDEHIAAIEAEYPQDAEGFAILPKSADTDALRVLKDTSWWLTKVLYHVGNNEITEDDDDGEEK
jgi:hypothetical protein